MDEKNVLVIVGPTAVGKTDLSIKLAKKFDGEIISCDSTQVYKMMDIGTAKATEEERKLVSHHLIDIFDPSHAFSVQEFQELAREKIEGIHFRGHLPILVGGTGLYIESVTHGYAMPHVPENHGLRQKLIKLADIKGNNLLHEKLKDIDPITAKKLHPNDRRRVIRAIEVYEKLQEPISSVINKKKPLYNLLWIGLTMPREKLYQRINHRVDLMIEGGLVREVISLKEKGYPRDLTSMQAIGYKEIMSYLEGEISLQDAVELIKKGTRRYAKRQFTWFRRIPEIYWFDVTNSGISKEIQQLIGGKFFL